MAKDPKKSELSLDTEIKINGNGSVNTKIEAGNGKYGGTFETTYQDGKITDFSGEADLGIMNVGGSTTSDGNVSASGGFDIGFGSGEASYTKEQNTTGTTETFTRKFEGGVDGFNIKTDAKETWTTENNGDGTSTVKGHETLDVSVDLPGGVEMVVGTSEKNTSKQMNNETGLEINKEVSQSSTGIVEGIDNALDFVGDQIQDSSTNDNTYHGIGDDNRVTDPNLSSGSTNFNFGSPTQNPGTPTNYNDESSSIRYGEDGSYAVVTYQDENGQSIPEYYGVDESGNLIDSSELTDLEYIKIRDQEEQIKPSITEEEVSESERMASLEPQSSEDDVSDSEIAQPSGIDPSVYQDPGFQDWLQDKLGDNNDSNTESPLTQQDLSEHYETYQEEQGELKDEYEKQVEEQGDFTTSGFLGAVGTQTVLLFPEDWGIDSKEEIAAAQAFMNTVGQNLGQEFDPAVYIDSGKFKTEEGFSDFDSDLYNNVKGAIVSAAVSSALEEVVDFGEGHWANMASIVAQGSLTAGTNSLINGQSFQEGFNNYFTGSPTTGTTSTTVSPDGNPTAFANAIGGYIGGQAAQYFQNIETEQEAVGSQIGSAVGTYVGTALLTPLIPIPGAGAAIGAFVGSYVGEYMGETYNKYHGNEGQFLIDGLTGQLTLDALDFIGTSISGILGGKKSPPPPRAIAKYEYNTETGEYELTEAKVSNSDGTMETVDPSTYSSEKKLVTTTPGNEGRLDLMVDIGKNITGQLTNVIAGTKGQVANPENHPPIIVNHTGSNLKINGESYSFDSEGIGEASNEFLSNASQMLNIEGGNPYIKKAFYNSDGENVMEDYIEGSRYNSYQNGTTVLDKEGNPITENEETLEQYEKDIEKFNNEEITREELEETYDFILTKTHVNQTAGIVEEWREEAYEKSLEDVKELYKNAKEENLNTQESIKDYIERVEVMEEGGAISSQQAQETLKGYTKDLEELKEKYTELLEKEAQDLDSLYNDIFKDIKNKDEVDKEIKEYQDKREEKIADWDQKILNEKVAVDVRIASFNDNYDPDGQTIFTYQRGVALIKSEHKTNLEKLQEKKKEDLEEFDEENKSTIDAIKWRETVSESKENLKLEEPHYSDDTTKFKEYVKHINSKHISEKVESVDIFETANELKSFYTNPHNKNSLPEDSEEKLAKLNKFLSGQGEEITDQQLKEMMSDAGIEVPEEKALTKEDLVFPLGNLELQDLRLQLKDGKLIIKTFDKDLSPEEAQAQSKTLVIEDWNKNWNKDISEIPLADGTRLNIKDLLKAYGVEEDGEVVDVGETGVELVEDMLDSNLHNNNNVLVGTGSDDILSIDKNGALFGRGGNDILDGSNFDDLFSGGAGADRMIGNDGNDTATYSDSEKGVNVSLERGGFTGDAAGDTFEGVENLIGSSHDDYLEGEQDNNTLDGGKGDDVLKGGDGSDVLIGGEGNDTAYYGGSSEGVSINLDRGDGVAVATGGSAEGDSFSSIENIVGSKHDDYIAGDKNDNKLMGGSGDDKLFGKEGNDVLDGGSGDDFLDGGKGNDILSGGEGNNILFGGEGIDTAIFDSSRDNYHITQVENGFRVDSLDGKSSNLIYETEKFYFGNDLYTQEDVLANSFIADEVLAEMSGSDSDDEENEGNSQNKGKGNNSNSGASTIALAAATGAVATTATANTQAEEIAYYEALAKRLERESGTPLEIQEEESVFVAATQDDIDTTDTSLDSGIPEGTSFTTPDTTDREVFQEEENDVDQQEVFSQESEAKTQDRVIETAIAQPVEENTEEQQVFIEEEMVAEVAEEEEIPPLLSPVLQTEDVKRFEDTTIPLSFGFLGEGAHGFEAYNPNSSSVLRVEISGIPEDATLSAGEKIGDVWYLSENEIQNLQIILKDHDSDDFTVEITVEVMDKYGRTKMVKDTQEFTIDAVADAPTLDLTQKLQGKNFIEINEDETVALDISTALVDTDGSENLRIQLVGLPDGASLNKGTKISDGSWWINPDEIEGLILTSGIHDGDDFVITVNSVTYEEENDSIAVTSGTIDVTVHAVADAPELEVEDGRGDEDTAIALNIKTSLVDGDLSESIDRIEIVGVPEGAQLSAGTKSEDGTWIVSSKHLEGLTLTPPENDGDDFQITVTSFTKEEENGDVATTTATIDITVDAVADEVVLDLTQEITGTNTITTSEGLPTPVDILAVLKDSDGSEAIDHYILEDLPPEIRPVTFPDGEDRGTEVSPGVWKLTPEEIIDLGLRLPTYSDEDFRLAVKAVTVEDENGDTQTTGGYIDVEVEALASGVNLSANGKNEEGKAVWEENKPVDLNISASLIDTDGSENLKIYIDNVPEGSSLSAGTKVSPTRWEIEKSNLEDLKFLPKEDFYGNVKLKVVATGTEESNNASSENVKWVDFKIAHTPKIKGIETQSVSGDEDSEIALNIQMTQPLRPLETITFELVVPEGMELNKGVETSPGIWKIEKEELGELNLIPSRDLSGVYSLDLVVTKSMVGEEYATKKKISIPVTINAVADDPELEVLDTYGSEDSMIVLKIMANSTDTDGSESVEVFIKDLPEDFILSAGEKENGVWRLTQNDLENLMLKPPANYSGAVTFTVENLVKEGNGDTNTITKSMTVDVAEELDEPTLTTYDSLIAEEGTKLNIVSLANGGDKEVLKIYIDGLPEDASLSAGTKEGDSWVVTANELEGLQVLNLTEEIDLDVKAVVSSGDKEIVKENTVSLVKEEEGVPIFSIDSIDTEVSNSSGDTYTLTESGDTLFAGMGNDTVEALGGNDVIYGDKTETQQVTISLSSSLPEGIGENSVLKLEGVPEGVTVSNGVLEDGVWILDSGSIETIVLSSSEYVEDFQLNFTLDSVVDVGEDEEDTGEDPVEADPEVDPETDPETGESQSQEDLGGDTPSTKEVSFSLSANISFLPVTGSDYIEGGGGSDTLYGEGGDDMIFGGLGNDTIDGGEGNDVLKGNGGADTFFGGEGDDTIVADQYDEVDGKIDSSVVDGGDGLDTLIVEGDSGSQIIMDGMNVENVIGGSGDDIIIGTDEGETVSGGSGSDIFKTGGGDDTIIFDSVDNKANSGDFLDGGEGYDTAKASGKDGVTLDVDGRNIESFVGSDGDDTFLNSGSSDMKIDGGKGDDTISATEGIDTLEGGDGTDTVNYSNSDEAVSVDLENSTVEGGHGEDDTISGFEGAIGSSYNDVLYGNSSNNIFTGGRGNDIMDGQGGYNTAVFSGNLSDYDFSGFNESDYSLTVKGEDGTDSLKNIQELVFDDVTVYLDRNNAPIANDDINVVTGREDTTLIIDPSKLLANDYDFDNLIGKSGTFKIESVGNGINGNVEYKNGMIYYTPNANFNTERKKYDKYSKSSEAGFEYTLVDSEGNRRTANAKFKVTAVDDAPFITKEKEFSRTDNRTGNMLIRVTDVDSDIKEAILTWSNKELIFTQLKHYTFGGYYELYRYDSSVGYASLNITTGIIKKGHNSSTFEIEYIGTHNLIDRQYVWNMRKFNILVELDNKFVEEKNLGVDFFAHAWDPIALDLDGDGLEFVDLSQGVYTDIDFDGNQVKTNWVAPDDGFLVWDADSDGKVSSLPELSWNVLDETAADDFEALKNLFDENDDNIFDENDSGWSDFLIWQDLNQNGVSDDGEMMTLEEAGIVSFDLDTKAVNNGDVLSIGSYTDKDGNKKDAAAMLIGGEIDETTKDLNKEADILIEQLAAVSGNSSSTDIPLDVLPLDETEETVENIF